MIKELKMDGCNKEDTIDEYGNIFDVKLQRYRKPIVHKKGYLKMSSMDIYSNVSSFSDFFCKKFITNFAKYHSIAVNIISGICNYS